MDHRLWMFDHPLRQFINERHLQAMAKLEEKKMGMERLRDMSADEIGKQTEGVLNQPPWLRIPSLEWFLGKL